MSELSAADDQPDPGRAGALARLIPDALGANGAPDIDHRLVFANVSKALFGRGATLQIGKYTVERRIGEGGMGEVYLCRDPDLDRKVAIKRVVGTASPRARARLRREAQALAALDHVNVVGVHDSGEHEGRLFVVMEYVEGQTLREWMAEPHPWTEVLDTLIAAGRGLAAAHAAGIVHRDFKPDNVLISSKGAVKVADFGLALRDEERAEVTVVASEASEELAVTEDAGPGATGNAGTRRGRLSGVGAVVGTREYMPLEQLLGAEVDARSDQFAFCMTLYEALWHERAFASVRRSDRREQLESGLPRRPSGHRALFRIIRRGLARTPSERWPDMDSLLDALAWVPRRRRLLRIGAVLVPALAALGLVLASAERAPRELAGIGQEQGQVGGLRPPAAAIADEVAAARAELARIEQLRARGTVDEALASLEAGEAQVDSLDYGPLRAEWQAALARSLEGSGQPERAAAAYDRALELAERHHHAQLAAEVALQRAELDAFELDDLHGAQLRYEQAARLASRVPEDLALAAGLAFGRGRLALADHDVARAEAHMREALELAPAAGPQRPDYLAGLAAALAAGDDAAGALDHHRQAHEAALALLGAAHPQTARFMVDYGLGLGRTDARGQELRERAVELARASQSAHDQAWAELHAAALALDRAQIERARLALERSLATSAVASTSRGDALVLLAGFEASAGQLDRAVDHATLALVQYDGSSGSVTAELAGGSSQRALETRSWLANVLVERDARGDRARARALLGEIIEGVDDHPRDAALAHLSLAELALLDGELDDAEVELRSCARARASLGPADARAYALLRALVDLRRGSAGAEDSVSAFVALLDQDPEADAARAELGAWLELQGDERERLGL